jgi:hypothetical protein
VFAFLKQTCKHGSKLASCPSVNGQVVVDLLSPELVKGGGTWVVPREFNSRPKMDEGFLCFLITAIGGMNNVRTIKNILHYNTNLLPE